MSISDIAAYMVRALGFIAVWLDRVSGPWPWPLVMAAGALVLISVLNFAVWILRGTAWPVRCKYPITTKRHGGDSACRVPVAGEWSYCRHHNGGARTVGTHQVDPKLPRWMTYDSNKNQVERRDLRVAGHRVSLLFYRGYARTPRQVWRTGWPDVLKEWKLLFGRLRQPFAKQRAAETALEPAPERSVSAKEFDKYRGIHQRAVSADQATTVLKVLLPVALIVSGVSAFLTGTLAVIVSYVAVLLLWMVFKIVRCGLWRVSDDGSWVTKTVRGVLKDFAIFVVASAALYYIATAVMPYLSEFFASLNLD